MCKTSSGKKEMIMKYILLIFKLPNLWTRPSRVLPEATEQPATFKIAIEKLKIRQILILDIPSVRLSTTLASENMRILEPRLSGSQFCNSMLPSEMNKENNIQI